MEKGGVVAASDGKIKEISCQQVLLPDGSLYSVQWMDFPPQVAVTASLLLERYMEWVRKVSFSLVRSVLSPQGVDFRLGASRLALLRFDVLRLKDDVAGQELRLDLAGGLMMQKGKRQGSLSFGYRKSDEAVRIKVQLEGFFPMLLGSPKPSWLRRLFYRYTQSLVHKYVTVGYLKRLYADLAGERVRTRVTEVSVKSGRPI